MVRPLPLLGGQAGADQFAQAVEVVRAHVGTKAFRGPAADGKQAMLAGTPEGDERRGTNALRGCGEEPSGLAGIEGAAAGPAITLTGKLTGRFGARGGDWLIVKKEGDGLGLEFPPQRILQQGLQGRPVRGGNELDHQGVDAGGEGLVVPGPRDELGEDLAIILDLVAQQMELVFDQGQGAGRAMGQAEAGGQVWVTDKEVRIGLQVGGDGLVPGCG